MTLLTEKAIEQARCSGCQVRSCVSSLADTRAEPSAYALSQAVVHSVGAPLMGSLFLVVMVDALGMGDAGQTMAAVLGLGLGMLLCTGMTAWPSGRVKAGALRVHPLDSQCLSSANSLTSQLVRKGQNP
jgi:hypothetical protein